MKTIENHQCCRKLVETSQGIEIVVKFSYVNLCEKIAVDKWMDQCNGIIFVTARKAFPLRIFHVLCEVSDLHLQWTCFVCILAIICISIVSTLMFAAGRCARLLLLKISANLTKDCHRCIP